MPEFNPAHPYLMNAHEELRIALAQSDLDLTLTKIQSAEAFLKNASDMVRLAKAKLRKHSDFCQGCWLGDHEK